MHTKRAALAAVATCLVMCALVVGAFAALSAPLTLVMPMTSATHLCDVDEDNVPKVPCHSDPVAVPETFTPAPVTITLPPVTVTPAPLVSLVTLPPVTLTPAPLPTPATPPTPPTPPAPAPVTRQPTAEEINAAAARLAPPAPPAGPAVPVIVPPVPPTPPPTPVQTPMVLPAASSTERTDPSPSPKPDGLTAAELGIQQVIGFAIFALIIAGILGIVHLYRKVRARRDRTIRSHVDAALQTPSPTTEDTDIREGDTVAISTKEN